MNDENQFFCVRCDAPASEWNRTGNRKMGYCKTCGQFAVVPSDEIKHLAEAKFYNDEKQVRYLLDPNLFENLAVVELGKRVVGEEGPRKAILLAGCSVFVNDEDGAGDRPNQLVNAGSSVGKEFTVRAVLDLFPRWEKGTGKGIVIRRTKLSPEAFTYWMQQEAKQEGFTWERKILYIPDIDQRLLDSPTFKTMMSDGSEATVVINQKSVELSIPGRPLFELTTAKSAPNEEMLNRFDLLHLDESKEQTRAINEFHADIAEGVKKQEAYSPQATGTFHALKQVRVRIPFARAVAAVFPVDDLRVRRAFRRLLAYIKASAALHQFQRNVLEEGSCPLIEAEQQDYEVARAVLRFVKIAGSEARLTNIKKKAWDLLAAYANDGTLEGRKFSIRELASACPSYSQEIWRRNLITFAGLGLVSSSLEEASGSFKPVQFYKLIGSPAGYCLPGFEDLMKSSISGIGRSCSISGISRIVGGNPTKTTKTTLQTPPKTTQPENINAPNSANPPFSEQENGGISAVAPGNRELEKVRREGAS